ncbi:hypothetical protein LLG95_05080 [bacterium]|nr:hypothetical protein [bacterium]
MAKQAKKTKERKPTRIEIIIRENPARAVVVGLAIVFVLRIGLFLTEANPVADTPAPPQKAPIPTQIAFGEQLVTLLKPRPAFDQSDFKELETANIFDPKQVLDPGEKARAAEQEFQNAYAAHELYLKTKKKEDLDAAKKAVSKTLAILPSHFLARQLRDKIDKEMGQETAAAEAAALAARGSKQTTGTTTQAPPPEPAPEQ